MEAFNNKKSMKTLLKFEYVSIKSKYKILLTFLTEQNDQENCF